MSIAHWHEGSSNARPLRCQEKFTLSEENKTKQTQKQLGTARHAEFRLLNNDLFLYYTL